MNGPLSKSNRPKGAGAYVLVRPPRAKNRGPALPETSRPEEASARAALRQEAEIESHLAFVREISGKHKIEPRDQAELLKSLQVIHEFEQEPRLFLGVVGEFSSGKSTLINALLRDDLLRTNVLQGTTAAATLLSYAPALSVSTRPLGEHAAVKALRSLWGAVTSLFHTPPPMDRESLRKRIHEVSAEETKSRALLQVEIGHPAAALNQGMVIVDLPGTNSDNPRHAEVTAAALRDLCDAAMIVIPSDAPGAETLWTFLQKHLDADVLRRCVFLLTKIDRVRRPRDRELLVNHIRTRLTNDFGIQNPRVIPVAPGRFMESLPGAVFESGDDPPTEAERQQWMSEFSDAESQLWQALHEAKLLLQVERLLRLLDQIFHKLVSILEKHERSYQEQHEALKANTIPDLGKFISEAQSRHRAAFLARRAPLTRRGRDTLAESWKSSVSELSSLIFGTSSNKDLQDAVKNRLPSALSSAERQLQKTLRKATSELERAADHEHRQFFEQFQGDYRRLATLGGRVQTRERRHESEATREFHAEMTSRHKEVELSIDAHRNAEFANKAGGAVGGAVLGTMILPGVGTIVGGVVGGLLGSLFGPPLSQLQGECWSKLAPALDASFAQFSSAAHDCLDRVGRELEESLVKKIGGYEAQYAQLVRDMARRDQEQARALEQHRQAVARDRGQIQNRQSQLSTIRDRLRTR